MKRQMKLGKFEDWLEKELKDPGVRRAYERKRRGLFLSYRILKLREMLGLSQKVIAKRMGTSQQAVARLESGEYEGFTLKTLEKVAEALGAELIIDLRKPARKPAI